MNLLELKTETLNHGFDPIQYGARIVAYLNDAENLIARRVDYYVDETSVPVTTAVAGPYFALPADFARVRTLVDTDRQVQLEYVSLRDIDRSGLSTGAPVYYAFNGRGVELYPTPEGVHNLQLRYWRMPPALTDDTDTPTLPVDWHNLLWTYAVARCYEADDDSTMGQYWESRFQTLLSMFAADVKFPSSDGPTQAKGMWDGERSLGGKNTWGLYGSGW